ncbi:carbohydrate-binding family 9-like protein [Coraliomargarita parva]|uniref:carbohydrate-binding family 9-like protein n=1 Tax=Coraliomargarita parva TaxID=3014050 RepID=UPI0022B4AF35|nr:carbohydrate-binding family 9-like protein [Coraliomargarita parva]
MSKFEYMIGLAALSLMAVGCSRQPLAAATVESPPYRCQTAGSPVVIDGRIDEAAWDLAEPITTFYAFLPADATELSATEARVLWDADYLYVSIVCTDTDIWSYSDEPDSDLWLGDVGEFFVKPDGDKPVYYEFVVAPNGTLFDARYPSRGAGGANRFKTWSSGAHVATSVDGTDGDLSDEDRSFTIEMAIPLTAFEGATVPADSVTWTFNFGRYDFSKHFEQPLLLMSMPESPRNGFHYYEGYTDLVFSKGLESK